MERRINSKIQLFQKQFKDDLCSRLKEMKTLEEISDGEIDEFIGYIYDYDTLKLETEDFTKRKRVKNHVPLYERCCALKSNGKQCTRRKKDNEDFCGTHIKGIPHGKINGQPSNDKLKKVEVFTKEIQGITYYLDKKGNVYDTHDIYEMKQNPKIITKYIIDNEGNYIIPTIFDN